MLWRSTAVVGFEDFFYIICPQPILLPWMTTSLPGQSPTFLLTLNVFCHADGVRYTWSDEKKMTLARHFGPLLRTRKDLVTKDKLAYLGIDVRWRKYIYFFYQTILYNHYMHSTLQGVPSLTYRVWTMTSHWYGSTNTP